jgi:hypothetical protein
MELSVASVPDAPNTASMLALCAAGLAILACNGSARPFVRPARGCSDYSKSMKTVAAQTSGFWGSAGALACRVRRLAEHIPHQSSATLFLKPL